MSIFDNLQAPADKAVFNTAMLQEAIRLGRAGEADRAHAALAEHFRSTREAEWPWVLRQARVPHEKVTTGSRPRSRRQRLTHTELPCDFDWREVVHDVNMLVLRPSAKNRDRLASRMGELIARRAELERLGPYPLLTMLGSEGQFDLFYRGYLALIRQGPIEPDLAEGALTFLFDLATAMRRATERYMVHNIFTAGVCGLFRIARAIPEFRGSAEWDAHALAHLDTDLDRSFFPDGGHAERNWGYSSYTLGRIAAIRRFALDRGGLGPYERHFEERLRDAYRFFALTLGPGDLAPGFGDEGLSPLGHVLDEGLATGLFPPGTTRDLGVDRSRSAFCANSGIAIFRNGGGPNDFFGDVTFGDFAGWHSHMDALSMDWRAMGEVLIQDVPRFGPYHHPMDTLWRGAEAHNQLLIDGFFYDSRPIVCQDVHWHSDDRLDYFSATHAAYRVVAPHESWRTYHMSADLIVRRTILFVKDPGYALVLDSVHDETRGKFNRSTSGWWHSPRPFRPLGPGRVQTAPTRRGVSCLLTFARPESIRRVEVGDDFTADESHDEIYGDRSWHRLRVNTWRKLPYDGSLGFAAVLFPFRGKRPPDVEIRALPIVGADPFRVDAFTVRTPSGLDRFALNPERRAGVSFRGKPVPRALVTLGSKRGEWMLK